MIQYTFGDKYEKYEMEKKATTTNLKKDNDNTLASHLTSLRIGFFPLFHFILLLLFIQWNLSDTAVIFIVSTTVIIIIIIVNVINIICDQLVNRDNQYFAYSFSRDSGSKVFKLIKKKLYNRMNEWNRERERDKKNNNSKQQQYQLTKRANHTLHSINALCKGDCSIKFKYHSDAINRIIVITIIIIIRNEKRPTICLSREIFR